jgi:hypothetical protein
MSRDVLWKHRVVAYLNRFDGGNDVHVRNAQWLRTREDLEVYTDIEALTQRMEPRLRR